MAIRLNSEMEKLWQKKAMPNHFLIIAKMEQEEAVDYITELDSYKFKYYQNKGNYITKSESSINIFHVFEVMF